MDDALLDAPLMLLPALDNRNSIATNLGHRRLRLDHPRNRRTQ